MATDLDYHVLGSGFGGSVTALRLTEKGYRVGVLDVYDVKHWSERGVIALVMQTLDNSITTYGKRSRLSGHWRMTSRQGHGEPNPTWIPVANEAIRHLARMLGGKPYGTIGEPFNMPMPAHFIGGCVIADGSTISANLGVNPSLTITAQAERAMSFWPSKGEPDTRPRWARATSGSPPSSRVRRRCR